MREISKFAHSAAISANLSALVASKRSTRQLFPGRRGPCPVRPPVQISLLWWLRSEVRGSFSQEGEVLVLFGHLAAQPQQLGPLGRTQRFTTGSFHGLQASTFVAHPLAQGVFEHRELAGHVSNRSSGVDDAMRSLSPELQRELPPGCSHGDILPAGSRVGLLGVYFLWGTSEVRARIFAKRTSSC